MPRNRILLIDDNRDTRQMLSLMLKVEGHEVASVSKAAAAFELLRTEPFDLVITDILMPDIDGLELITRLRRDYPSLKIIAMSAGGRIGPEAYLEIASKLGAEAVLRKPFTQNQMLETVKAVLAA